MTKWALKLEYNGTAFVGWQRQDSGISLQEVLEQAATNLNKGAAVSSIVAGRTDSGVHAEAQVVREAAVAPDGWNPRFSAIHRAYRYRLLNRRARPALMEGQVWHVAAPLDAGKMHEASRLLLGTHDFTSFRASACQAKSPIRTLERLDVTQDGELIVFAVEARSFLHHQVRNFVGTLRLVGDGSWPVERVSRALAARDRAAAGPTAPAAGLSLVAVTYKVDPFAVILPTAACPAR